MGRSSVMLSIFIIALSIVLRDCFGYVDLSEPKLLLSELNELVKYDVWFKNLTYQEVGEAGYIFGYQFNLDRMNQNREKYIIERKKNQTFEEMDKLYRFSMSKYANMNVMKICRNKDSRTDKSYTKGEQLNTTYYSLSSLTGDWYYRYVACPNPHTYIFQDQCCGEENNEYCCFHSDIRRNIYIIVYAICMTSILVISIFTFMFYFKLLFMKDRISYKPTHNVMHLRAQMTTNIRNKTVPPLCTPATMYGYGHEGYGTSLNPLGVHQKLVGIDALLIQLMIQRDPDIINECPTELTQKYFSNIPEMPADQTTANQKKLKNNKKELKKWPRKPVCKNPQERSIKKKLTVANDILQTPKINK